MNVKIHEALHVALPTPLQIFLQVTFFFSLIAQVHLGGQHPLRFPTRPAILIVMPRAVANRRAAREDNDPNYPQFAPDDDLHERARAKGDAMTAPLMPENAPAAPRDYTSAQLLDAVMASLDDDKAEEIVQIDLRGRSSMGDYMVIASGRSTRQVASIAEKLADRLKQDFSILCKMEGREAADWVLIDTGDIIVHIFRPEVREFYQLEKMWMPGAPGPDKFR